MSDDYILRDDGTIILYPNTAKIPIRRDLIQSVVFLCIKNSKLGSTKQIASKLNISASYVLKILQALRHLGFSFVQEKAGASWIVTKIPDSVPSLYANVNEVAPPLPSGKMEKRPMPELPPHRELGNSIIISKEAYYAWVNAWQFIYPEYDTLVDLFNGD